MMNSRWPYLVLGVLAIAFGVFMVIYGGYDDSPGAQALGLLAALGGGFSLIKKRKN